MPAPPYLKQVVTIQEKLRPGVFPFDLPLFADGINLTLKSAVTFFVGENGCGKSTLLEGIAEKCGFGSLGGNRNHAWQRPEDDSPLASAMRLAWAKKATRGFFLRAESFFDFAGQLERSVPEALAAYGGTSLLQQSHGESFLALFTNKFRDGLFILDEPEAALSPQRQLSLLRVLYDLERSGGAQFLIATHSPMLFSYPGATVYSIEGNRIEAVDYRETEHYQTMRRFLEAPDRYFRHLFEEG